MLGTTSIDLRPEVLERQVAAVAAVELGGGSSAAPVAPCDRRATSQRQHARNCSGRRRNTRTCVRKIESWSDLARNRSSKSAPVRTAQSLRPRRSDVRLGDRL